MSSMILCISILKPVYGVWFIGNVLYYVSDYTGVSSEFASEFSNNTSTVINIILERTLLHYKVYDIGGLILLVYIVSYTVVNYQIYIGL